MSVWILLAERPYDPPDLIGVFPDEDAAAAAALLLDAVTTGRAELAIMELPTLGLLTAEPVDQVLHCRAGCYWDGRKMYEQVGEVETRVIVRGLPDGQTFPEGGFSPVPPLEVERKSFESGYTLGVYVDVRGSDLDAVRAAFAEERAALLADPAGATVRAWVGRERVPPWVWGRPENQGLLDALEAAGFDRITNGPLGS